MNPALGGWGRADASFRKMAVFRNVNMSYRQWEIPSVSTKYTPTDTPTDPVHCLLPTCSGPAVSGSGPCPLLPRLFAPPFEAVAHESSTLFSCPFSRSSTQASRDRPSTRQRTQWEGRGGEGRGGGEGLLDQLHSVARMLPTLREDHYVNRCHLTRVILSEALPAGR